MPRSTCRGARKHTEEKLLAASNRGIASQKGVSTKARMIDHHHFPCLHDALPCRSQVLSCRRTCCDQRQKSALQHGEGTASTSVAHLDEVDRADSMNRTTYPSTSVPSDDLDPTRNINYLLAGENPLPRLTHAYLSGDGHGTEARAMWYEFTFMSYWRRRRRRRRRRRGPVPRVLGAIQHRSCILYNGFTLWSAVRKGIVSVFANFDNAVPSRCLQLYKLGKDGNEKVFKGVGYLAIEETKPSELISGYTAEGSGAVLGFPAALLGVEFTARNNRASC
ncbi:hypothetical protein QR685DRAFT_568196 [Neurospora intermedia]|uniref:Uncharacterized protein n=1 Tax=Neurospora intermedia TaxID=5142 RepID=A0ABR3DRV7_NEUIN